MDFKPVIRAPRPMDACIFADQPINLRARLAEAPLAERFTYDPKLRMLFIDFRNLAIRNEADILRIRAEVERHTRALQHSICAIVNDKGCRVEPVVHESYGQLVADLERLCGLGVTRYGTPDVLGPAALDLSDESAAPAGGDRIPARAKL